ncbi:MAG: hypothetical protein ACRDNS_07890, partial [Trebonia sp.]
MVSGGVLGHGRVAMMADSHIMATDEFSRPERPTRAGRNDSAALTQLLAMPDQHITPGLRIHLIMDNGSSRTSKATRAWIAGRPRFSVA